MARVDTFDRSPLDGGSLSARTAVPACIVASLADRVAEMQRREAAGLELKGRRILWRGAVEEEGRALTVVKTFFEATYEVGRGLVDVRLVDPPAPATPPGSAA